MRARRIEVPDAVLRDAPDPGRAVVDALDAAGGVPLGAPFRSWHDPARCCWVYEWEEGEWFDPIVPVLARVVRAVRRPEEVSVVLAAVALIAAVVWLSWVIDFFWWLR